MQWLRRRAAATPNAQEDADIFKAAILSSFWAHQFAHGRLASSAGVRLARNSQRDLSQPPYFSGVARSWSAGRDLLYEGQMDQVDSNVESSLWAPFDKHRGGESLIKQRRDERRKLVSDCIAMQLARLFAHIEDDLHWGSDYKSPYPPSHDELRRKFLRSRGDQLSAEDQTRSLRSVEVNERLMGVPLAAECFESGENIPHPDGFSLQVRKSDILHTDSGYGLFVDGTVCPGTVISLYPGSVYFSSQLNEDITRDNDYMISRYDGAVIDGRDWGQHADDLAQRIRALQLGSGEATPDPKLVDQLKKYSNPFALGNLINHPSPGAEPNVLACAFDFTASPEDYRTLPKDLQDFIPNTTPHESLLYGSAALLQRSVVLIAARALKDEELLLNYRYNPVHPYPEWFHQPNEDEANLRWAKPKIFGGLLGGR